MKNIKSLLITILILFSSIFMGQSQIEPPPTDPFIVIKEICINSPTNTTLFFLRWEEQGQRMYIYGNALSDKKIPFFELENKSIDDLNRIRNVLKFAGFSCGNQYDSPYYNQSVALTSRCSECEDLKERILEGEIVSKIIARIR